MKRSRVWLWIGLAGGFLALLHGSATAADPSQEVKAPAAQEAAGPGTAAAPPAVTIKVDQSSLDNGGTLQINGTAPAGKPVYIEVTSEQKVRASRFDADLDKDTGKRPYILYMTEDMPAFYKLFMPKEQKEALEKLKNEGSKWSVSKALKDLGADAAYSAPAKAGIDRYQATLLGSVIGSRGELLAKMDAKENRKRSMQLLKAKLWQMKQEMQDTEEKRLKGEYKAASWGNQIRSYVLHPYKLVKDLRTEVETSDAEGILDGDLDEFVEAQVRSL